MRVWTGPRGAGYQIGGTVARRWLRPATCVRVILKYRPTRLSSPHLSMADIGSAGPFDARQMTMGAVYRRAMRKDASRLYDVRRRSILELAPPTMPAAEARAWASKLTLSGMGARGRAAPSPHEPPPAPPHPTTTSRPASEQPPAAILLRGSRWVIDPQADADWTLLFRSSWACLPVTHNGPAFMPSSHFPVAVLFRFEVTPRGWCGRHLVGGAADPPPAFSGRPPGAG